VIGSIVEKAYQTIESSLTINYLSEKVTYTSPVNFQESLNSPRHRWFPYKEGFSPRFVENFICKYMPPEAKIILDPFQGVGTTLIEGAKLGFHTYGFEVNPLARFISQTKTINLDNDEQLEFSRIIKSYALANLSDIAPIPENTTVISYFEEEVLEALLKYKSFYLSISENKYRDLFKLVFLGMIERFSTHRKAGNGVKKRTKILYGYNVPILEQIKEYTLIHLKEIANDLKQSFNTEFVNFNTSSCLVEEAYPETKFDCVLTSPPYANCFDYSKIYMCELWLGDFFTGKECQVKFRQESIRSHVHARWESRNNGKGSELILDIISPYLATLNLWSKQIPSMLEGYFEDIGHLLHILSSRVNSGVYLGFVVSNSVYGGIPIATDLLISELGKREGYETVSIDIYRNIIPSSQQYKSKANKKYFRESLVILRKK